MKTILFLHGFFASGDDPIVTTMASALGDKCRVVAPDLSIHPRESIEIIRRVIDAEQPDLIVGNSCGSFYAQMVAPIVGIAALLGNPCFAMSEFLKSRKGTHRFKYPRRDGQMEITIDDALISEFEEMESEQWDCCSPYYTDKVWGIFGDNDDVANCKPQFAEHYNTVLTFPGKHVPTDEEVKTWYVPAIEKMLDCLEKTGERLFMHFKGNKYRFVHSAYDSETLERKVVYQALYGEKSYWVRPEKMFFERVTREGKTFNRFTEI